MHDTQKSATTLQKIHEKKFPQIINNNFKLRNIETNQVRIMSIVTENNFN